MAEKEDLAIEALLNFLDAVEAGAASAKHLISGKKIAEVEHPDYDLLFWETKQGNKGEYQQTSRANNKTAPFDKLAASLKEHNGFWKYKGYQYWFDMGKLEVVDRRKL